MFEIIPLVMGLTGGIYFTVKVALGGIFFGSG